MDSEQPIEDSVHVAPPESGVGASEESFTSAGEFSPELDAQYKSMQADYTRKTQELAELRREAEQSMEFMRALEDEESRTSALRQLAEAVGQETFLTAAGYEVDGEDNGLEEDDDFSFADPRVDKLAAEWESYKQSQEERSILSEIESFTESEMARLDVSSDAEQQAVLSIAATMELDRNGLPQIEAAKSVLADLYGEQQQSWIKSKKAPRQPLQGSQGEQTYDFSNEDERRARFAALLEANDE